MNPNHISFVFGTQSQQYNNLHLQLQQKIKKKKSNRSHFCNSIVRLSILNHRSNQEHFNNEQHQRLILCHFI